MNIEGIGDFTKLSHFGVPEAVIMLGLGLAVLCFGYRIKKVAFFIIWFLLGYNLVNILMPNINDLVPEIASSSLYQILLPIAGGLLLALMGFSIEKLCVGGICFALVMIIAVRYFGADLSVIAVGGVIGVLAAGVAVMMMKPATIIATSVAGGYALTLGFLALNPQIDFGAFYWPILLGVSAVGAVFQFATTKRIS